MFLIFFTVFTIIYTVFENIFLLITVFLFSLVILYIVKIIKRIPTKKILKLFWFSVLALTVVILSVWWKNQRYKSIAGQKYRNWTGIIESLYKNETLVLDTNDWDFLLKTAKSYTIGDEIFVSWIMRASYTPKSLLNISKQWEEFRNFQFFSDIFEYEFSYPKRLFMQGISADIREQNSVKIAENKLNFVQKLRVGLYENVQDLYGQNKYTGLILGMLIGDRYQIPKDSYTTFQQSGLVHIIAVSGGNIMIIVIFMSFLLFWIPFYIRKFVIWAAIIVYALVCGMDSSIVRATIMGILWIIAIFVGREISIYRAMAIAYFLMLLYNPYFLVYDIGFILSFSAIIGILLIEKIFPLEYSKAKNWKQKLKKSFLAMLYPTIGATVGVLPILLFYMGDFNIVWMVANIVVLPIVGLVMISAFITSYVNLLIPWDIRWLPVKGLVRYIYHISEWVSQYWVYINISSLWLKYFLLISRIAFVVWFLMWGKEKENK